MGVHMGHGGHVHTAEEKAALSLRGMASHGKCACWGKKEKILQKGPVSRALRSRAGAATASTYSHVLWHIPATTWENAGAGK